MLRHKIAAKYVKIKLSLFLAYFFNLYTREFVSVYCGLYYRLY